MTTNYDDNPFVRYFKARMQGGSFEEAAQTSGLPIKHMGSFRTVPSGELIEDEIENETEDPVESVDQIRARVIAEALRREIEEVALAGVIEGAKATNRRRSIQTVVANRIVDRLTEQLEWRFDLAEEWAGVVLAMAHPRDYNVLFETEESSRATYDALVEALERAIDDYR